MGFARCEGSPNSVQFLYFLGLFSSIISVNLFITSCIDVNAVLAQNSQAFYYLCYLNNLILYQITNLRPWPILNLLYNM